MKTCLVYLSGPITAKHGHSIEQNVADALTVYLACLAAGIPAFCPHLSGAFPTAHLTIDYQTWMDYDFAVIDHCTHMLMLPRWELSNGARLEKAHAELRRVPICYSLEELIKQTDSIPVTP